MTTHRRHNVRRRLAATLGLAAMLLASSSCAGSVALIWDAPTNNADGTVLTDLAGYQLGRGTSSSNYTSTQAVGVVTNLMVTGLTEGTTYYFSLKAVNTAGALSDWCPECSYLVPLHRPKPPKNLKGQ